MTENKLRVIVLLSAYDGMINNISREVRIISIDWNFKLFHIKAIYNRPVTEDDKADIGAISAEVLASVSTMIDCIEEVEYSELPIMQIPRLGKTLFIHKEELQEN